MDSSEKIAPVAIVTGSSRGIGFETAKAFCEAGYKVVLSGTKEEGLNKAKSELESLGYCVIACLADVSTSEGAKKLVDTAVNSFGRVDTLVNNAGITKDGLLLRMSEEDFDKVININLKGTFLMSKTVAKVMLRQKSGCVINIASVVGLMGNVGQANYAASKAGIIGFTKTFAKEFGKKGIRSNVIAPGFIETDMTAQLSEETRNQMQAQIPMGILGKPRDVANAAVFLASEKASYITGQVLTVDGGMVMY